MSLTSTLFGVTTRRLVAGGVLAFSVVGSAAAQGVRDFTRSKGGSSAALTDAQAAEVTLTLTDAQLRPIQTWVRAAGKPDGRMVSIRIAGAQAQLVQIGQRLRAFSVASRAQMQQGRVTKVSKSDDGFVVLAELASPLHGDPPTCIVEIVTERGPYLSIPNVSIIEEGDEKVVYLKAKGGGFERRVIKTGIQGELYTQVTDGLAEADEVVSVGSFFVDADAKLKSTGSMPPMPGMDHGSMPGMNHSMPMSTVGNGGAPAPGPLKATMTDPADNTAVTAPMMIHIMFSRPVDPAQSQVSITNDKGARIPAGSPAPMGRDGLMLMVMPDAPLTAGGYRVEWRTVGLDKTAVEGVFSFKVK